MFLTPKMIVELFSWILLLLKSKLMENILILLVNGVVSSYLYLLAY